MNARSSSPGEHSPALEALLVANKKLNEKAVIYLAVAVGCLICVLSAVHLITLLLRRYRRDAQLSIVVKPFTTSIRWETENIIR